jgi:hypothetical protein
VGGVILAKKATAAGPKVVRGRVPIRSEQEGGEQEAA